MTTLALLLLFPLMWPFAAKLIWKHEIALPEMAANLAIGVLVVTLGWAAGRYAAAHDVEVVNGQVTGKRSERVSCEHSYRCNCRKSCSGTGNNRSCSETCDTCHEHLWDIDWVLDTTIGDIRIRRIDRRGTNEPPRYTQAAAGDPVADTRSYTNYIKAAPDSLFNALSNKQALEAYQGKLVEYPSKVYDYHYVDRVLALGVSVPDLKQWNLELAQALRIRGAAKEVNAVVVFTKEADPQFATALNAAWLGGKKNDVVVVVGAPNYPEIGWVRVLSWTKAEVFKVQLRDALLDLKTVDRSVFLQTVFAQIDKGFVRRPMSDFEYLKDQVEPPTWVTVLLVLLSIVASVGASVYFSRNNYRPDGSPRRFGWR